MNGCARRESSPVRNDESFSVEPAPPTAPDLSCLANSAFFGSASAAMKSGVLFAAPNAAAMFFGRVLNRIDRKTATPSVPPICRKNVADDVATPMSRGETAFCTARIIGCMAVAEAEAEDRA